MRAALAILALLVASAAPHALAGSQSSPEAKDAQYDQKVTVASTVTPVGSCAGAPPTGCVYIPADIWGVWVTESGTNVRFHLELAQAPPSTFGDVTYTVLFAVRPPGASDAKAYQASATVSEASPAGSGMTSPGGAATAASLDATVLTLTVPRSAIGDAPGGSVITSLYATSLATAGPSGQEDVSDRAPDSGFGSNYTLAGGPTATTTGPYANSTTRTATGAPTTTGRPVAPAAGNGTSGAPTSVQQAPEAARGNATSDGAAPQDARRTPIAPWVGIVALAAAAVMATRRRL